MPPYSDNAILQDLITAAKLGSLPDAIARLTEPEGMSLLFNWRLWARQDQLPPEARAEIFAPLAPQLFAPGGRLPEGEPPGAGKEQSPGAKAPGDWRTWLLLGGRGSGKTRAGAEWVRAQALGLGPLARVAVGRIALIGESINDVRSVMVGIHPASTTATRRHQAAFADAVRAACQFHGSSSLILRAEWSARRARTSASQARASTPLSLQVSMSV